MALLDLQILKPTDSVLVIETLGEEELTTKMTVSAALEHATKYNTGAVHPDVEITIKYLDDDVICIEDENVSGMYKAFGYVL